MFPHKTYLKIEPDRLTFDLISLSTFKSEDIFVINNRETLQIVLTALTNRVAYCWLSATR